MSSRDEYSGGFAFAGGWATGDDGSGACGWGGGPHLGRMMRHFARRFPFGPGAYGPGMGPRMFGRGDLKYGLLTLLRERPMHGYEMIKELESQSGGFYTPSAGAIYPTLQLLEDRGWVTAEIAEGKKVYTITEDGQHALNDYTQRERPGPGFGPGFGPDFDPRHEGPEGRHGPHGPHGHHHHGPGEHFPWEARHEMRELAHEAREVAHLMRQAVLRSGGDLEQLKQIQAVVERARTDLTAYLRQQATAGGTSATGQGSSGTNPDEPRII